MSGKMHIYNAATAHYCLPAIRLNKEQILFHAGYLPHNIVAETILFSIWSRPGSPDKTGSNVLMMQILLW